MSYDEDNETQPCCGACGYPIGYESEDNNDNYPEYDFDDLNYEDEPDEYFANKLYKKNSSLSEKLDLVIHLLQQVIEKNNNN